MLLLTLALAGCAGAHRGEKVAPPNAVAVRGRDVGHGGATSGGVSSLDAGGNAADYSPLARYGTTTPPAR